MAWPAPGMDGRHESLWIATSRAGVRSPLEGKQEADVCVVGAGIVGLSAAHLLAEQGKSVIVLERGRILEGVTGKTTAKVTSQHGLVYATLRKRFGAERARIHADASEAGRAKILELLRATGDADYVEAPSFVYTQDKGKVEELREEEKAAREFGLPAEFTTETELPFAIEGAVRFDGQGHFHPRKYLLALARLATKGAVTIHEDSAVTSIHSGEPCTVKTERGSVAARHVLVATHAPISDRAFFVTRMQVRREYVVAMPSKGKGPKGMHVNADEPRRSVRPYQGEGGPMLVVAGESHPVGEHEDTQRHFDALGTWASDHFDVGAPEYYWSTQDYYPVDDVPLIGRHNPTTSHVFAATGFRAWGMTTGTAAAMMLADLVTKGKSPWSDLYDPYGPARLLKDLVQPAFFRGQATAVAGLIGSRLHPDPAKPLQPGEGRVMDDGMRKVAVCRDRNGKLHAVHAACTHMGCIVRWNEAEQGWDCPCHGSRFAPDGAVLHGPATAPLGRGEVPKGAQ